jgi:hypothetical protein
MVVVKMRVHNNCLLVAYYTVLTYNHTKNKWYNVITKQSLSHQNRNVLADMHCAILFTYWSVFNASSVLQSGR